MSQTIKKTIGEGFARGELYAALAYNENDQFGGMKIKGIAFTPVAGKPAFNVGDSTTAWTALYGDRAISIYSTCADTGTGNAMPVYISATMSGTGGLGRALEAVLNVTGKLGSYGNALKGYINLTTGTGTSGLASAVCAEMKMPAGTALGTFGVLELELVTPGTGWTAGTGTGTNCISWIYAEVSGTLKTQFNEYGYLFNLQGLTSSTTDLLYNNTLKCAIGSTKWYIPMSSAQGSYTTAYPIITTAVDPDAAYNGIYTTVTQANTYSGSIAGNRTTLTISAAAAIGNAYAGRFELIQSALPTSQGHTAALYAQVNATGTGHNPTSVLTLCRAGNTTGVTMPFINFLDANTNKTTILFELGTGNAVGTGTSGTALFETSASIGAVDEITAGLRVKVNGVDYYLLMATPADIQD